LVVFTEADKLKISGTDLVVSADDILRKIKNFTAVIFSDIEREKIGEILTKANIIDKQARRLHNQGANVQNSL